MREDEDEDNGENGQVVYKAGWRQEEFDYSYCNVAGFATDSIPESGWTIYYYGVYI